MAVTTDFIKTFTAGEALAAYRRVKLSSGSGTQVEYANQSDSSTYIGVTTQAAASGDHVPVHIAKLGGTVRCEAADTFSVGATLYAADDGKVSDTSSGNAIGTALEACTAAGDVVEVLQDLAYSAITFNRASIVQEDLARYPILTSQLRVWDAPSTVAVAATAANDDLAVVYNTFGTAGPTVETGDLKAAGATTRKVGFQVALPPEYVDGETLTLRVNAGMKTTVSDGTATVDAEVVNLTDDATSDICATAAQSINSLTAADKDFTITPTDCEAGDLLAVVLSVAVNDSSTGTAVIGQINSIALLADIKG